MIRRPAWRSRASGWKQIPARRSLRPSLVISAKAGIQEIQSLVPCSSQGQALGPRFRGDNEFVSPRDFPDSLFRRDDEFVCPKNFLATCFAGVTITRISGQATKALDVRST